MLSGFLLSWQSQRVGLGGCSITINSMASVVVGMAKLEHTKIGKEAYFEYIYPTSGCMPLKTNELNRILRRKPTLRLSHYNKLV